MFRYNRSLLREQIKIITPEQCLLLIEGKLPKDYRIKTGLYMARDGDMFIACDYSDPEQWAQVEERDGFPRNLVYMPEDGEGWVEEFENPLDAIDYLLGVSPDMLRGEG